MNEYKFISSPGKEKEKISSKEPFSVPSRSDHIYERIDDELIRINPDYNEYTYSLVSGTINLINFLHTKFHEGEPIDTIFFLDKSARLAAHFFQKIWSLLEKRGDISSIKKPKIKFLNIGHDNHPDDYEKHNERKPLSMLSKTYPPKDLEGNVLIVDEVISSGNTTNKALDVLKKTYGAQVMGIQNFSSLPGWYYKDRLKGVRDPDIDTPIPEIIENLSSAKFKLINDWIKSNKKGEKFLIDFIEETRRENKIRSKIKKIFYRNKLKRALNEISSNVQPEQIVDYFKSLGGLLARKETNEQFIKQNLGYRKSLSLLAKKILPHISKK